MGITQAGRERQVIAGIENSCEKAPTERGSMVGLWNSGRACVSGMCRQRSLKQAEVGEVGYRVIPSRTMKAMFKIFVFILRAEGF